MIESPSATPSSLETAKDLGTNQEALARRWKLELQLAKDREKDWRKAAADIYKLYTPNTPASNSFNIFWSNTETLRQATYNSVPEPICRRRYSDEDPLGLKAGEVLTRALEFSQDCGDFDHVCQQLVLGMLIAGRSVTWERYVPSITKDAYSEEPSEDAESEEYEKLAWEQVISEKVQYDDFRILCAAKTWTEVTAIARRHTLNRQQLIDQFGEEIGSKIKLNKLDIGEGKEQEQDLFKTAEVWEIWDKDTKRIIFICENYPLPLSVEDDELELENFFPVPRPLYAIENDNSLIPACLYTQYEQQARELNRISNRINKLVDALRLRGVYDATLTEISQLMKSGDNDLIPSQNVRALLERGGLEKAIWMMPIDVAAMVLKELYQQREAIKQVIYELTGISDIMRAATNPEETFGAQKIKTQWGTQRLQRMQREVQRYIRDMLRLKAEIICKKFQPETLAKMTMVDLPTQQQIVEQVQQMYAQYQQQTMVAAQQGQQVPPFQPPPMPITWEAVIALLRDDAMRDYHIDIETDSTLSATQNQDAEGLQAVLKGLVEIINGFGPAVQGGFIPVDAVKAIMGVAVRRARMGTAVEEALDKIQQPPPQPNPEQIKAQAAQQQQMMQQQHEQQLEQLKAQNAQQVSQAQMQSDIVAEKARAQADIMVEQARVEATNRIEGIKVQMAAVNEQQKLQAHMAQQQLEQKYQAQIVLLQQQLDRYKHETGLMSDIEKAKLDSATKIAVAQINAQAGIDQATLKAADSEVSKDVGE